MNIFLKLILYCVDAYNKRKILVFFKKILKEKFLTIIDVGAHEGETLKFFFYNFKIKSIIGYEASKINFHKLKNCIKKIKTNNPSSIIEYNNIALGEKKMQIEFYQTSESSSSTFCKINYDSSYFKRKKKILNFFFKKNYISKSEIINLEPLKNELQKYNLGDIDILKIDTEGFEFNILKGLGDKISSIKYIYFEHHFDNMIIKNYKYRDINNYLNSFNFHKVLKLRMPLRKTFEYIYENKAS
jgi:FkbM family methyltransferase